MRLVDITVPLRRAGSVAVKVVVASVRRDIVWRLLASVVTVNTPTMVQTMMRGTGTELTPAVAALRDNVGDERGVADDADSDWLVATRRVESCLSAKRTSDADGSEADGGSGS